MEQRLARVIDGVSSLPHCPLDAGSEGEEGPGVGKRTGGGGCGGWRGGGDGGGGSGCGRVLGVGGEEVVWVVVVWGGSDLCPSSPGMAWR